jgi:hypothetical protein
MVNVLTHVSHICVWRIVGHVYYSLVTMNNTGENRSSGATQRGVIPHWGHLERLAKALKHAGKTKADAAEYLQLSETTINNYLSGRHPVPFPVMVALSYWTGVDLAWLQDDDYDKCTPTNDMEAEQ